MEKKDDLERVQKIIAESGFCSRRKAEEFIEKGQVFVNDKQIKLGDKADASKDKIRIGNKQIKKKKKIYIMLNKPRGYITTADDIYERKKVTDLIDVGERLFYVGRLDRDASGLLLMTNDGDWANGLMHPSKKIDKEYHAELDRPIDKKTLGIMNKGFKLNDGYFRPRVKMISKNFCSLIIHEGKNKIVKRIFNEFGYRVIQLKRVKVGDYRLGKLKPGEWKYITP